MGKNQGFMLYHNDLHALEALPDADFKSEIKAVAIPQKGKPDIIVSEDEHPRPDTTMETLQKLKAIYPEGVTTAGNASGVNDGAGAMLVASRDAGQDLGQGAATAGGDSRGIGRRRLVWPGWARQLV